MDLNGPDGLNSNRPAGYDFPGYHFQRDRRRPQRFHRWPRAKSVRKLEAALRAQTPRTSGRSLPVIIANVNRTLRGWFEYFKHTKVATAFPKLDGRLRRRLRPILLERRKQHRHPGRGRAHRRRPNAYSAEHGLYSLVPAHALARQSARW